MTKETYDIPTLEKIATQLLKEKRAFRARRPIVIEFCGTPKAGKSSCISSLVLFLKRNGFKVKVLTERASVCPIENKFDPNFNIWTACSALAELVHILSNEPRSLDVVILDRGMFDAVCWFHWQNKHNFLDDKSYELFRKFFFNERWANKIDIVYILGADPKTALQREYANLLTRKTGSVMNQRVLSSYNLAIEECALLYADEFRQIKSINTDDLSQNDVSFDVTIDILVALSKLISEQIGYFDRSVIQHLEKDAFHYTETGMPDSELQFNGRAEVENDERLIQPIPVAVITSLDKSQVLIVRKKNNATRNGSAERGKDLFYFGGHVRLEDKQGHGSNLDIFQSGLLRELKEELGLDYVPNFQDPICIVDRSRQKMNHIAICTLCTIDFSTINFKGDGLEFRDASLKRIRQSDFRNDRLRPERWSQLIIQHVLNWTFI